MNIQDFVQPAIRWHIYCIAMVMQNAVLRHGVRSFSTEIRTELIRKSIHLSVALAPSVAQVLGTSLTIVLLAIGTIAYTGAEYTRQRGGRIPFVSRLTELSARTRDQHHFVLGPVTLGLGAMLALMLYPAPASAIAIYALAFGDGFASLVGKLVGRTVIPWTGGKTLEGSVSCALAVVAASYVVYPNPLVVVVAAISASVLEMLPTGDADNLVLPAGVGLVVTALL